LLYFEVYITHTHARTHARMHARTHARTHRAAPSIFTLLKIFYCNKIFSFCGTYLG